MAAFFDNKEVAGKVLLIEDDALLAKVLGDSLKNEGFEVLIVSEGTTAFSSAVQFQPKVILLDLILPGLDGFAVLKQLKADEKTKNTPVAIISNLGDVGDVKSAKALGAEEYFIKANTELEKIIQFVKKHV